jgi:hypothetical protein
MSTELKYVRHSSLGFVLWPKSDDLWHSHMGALLRRVPGEIVSAGFAIVAAGIVNCYGRSESLDISSVEGDSDALAKQLGLDA